MEEIKTKEKWTLEVLGVSPETEVTMLKIPSMYHDVVQWDLNNESNFFAGRANWEPFKIGVEGLWGRDIENSLLNWSYDIFSNFDNSRNYSKTGILKCSNGLSFKIEKMWPQAIDYGQLDFSSSVIPIVELTFVYSKAIMQEEQKPKRRRKLSLNWENK
jgi:hypothetical protein